MKITYDNLFDLKDRAPSPSMDKWLLTLFVQQVGDSISWFPFGQFDIS